MIMFRRAATLVAVSMFWAAMLVAQTPDSTARRQQRTLDSLAAVMRRMQARLDSLSRGRPAADSGGDELAALRAAAAAPADTAAAPAPAPQQARLGQNALNPEISVTGDIRMDVTDPRPTKGTFAEFRAREFEFGFQSVLDPFTTAKITATFGEDGASVEEGYFFFPALPGGFRLDVGRFRQDVGELNRWHLHALPEDEYPLVIRRYAGDEGVSGTGLSLYRALPFSGRAGTYELTLQGTTGDNEVLFTGGGRPSIAGKLAAFWQLSRSAYLMASVSGMYGTNPDTSLKSQLIVGAARFTWRPPQSGQSRELTVRGEYWSLRRQFAGAGPTRGGWFAGATWKLGRRWIAGARYDRVQSPDGPGTEWAVTPSLTFWQSEFVYLRAIGEHARDIAGATTNRFSVQAVFAMGPHKHELF